MLGVTAAALPGSAEAHTNGAPEQAKASGSAKVSLDPALLAALGDAVLPESLGASGRGRAVAAFAAWLAAEVQVAEQMPGYGDAALPAPRPAPGPGGRAQVDGL
ncbi:MAG: hypothetical protein ACKOFX_11160, partial [Solirubrobacterales bacterium]